MLRTQGRIVKLNDGTGIKKCRWHSEDSTGGAECAKETATVG
jgi:hypothetical protein